MRVHFDKVGQQIRRDSVFHFFSTPLPAVFSSSAALGALAASTASSSMLVSAGVDADAGAAWLLELRTMFRAPLFVWSQIWVIGLEPITGLLPGPGHFCILFE